MKVTNNQTTTIKFSLLIICSAISPCLSGKNQESTIPVIFFHKGDSFYLKDSLWQAKQYNKKIILIGDETNNHYEDIEHYDMSNYFETARFFGKKKYIHLSESPALFEWLLLCCQRWFVLHEFMEKQNINRCFYVDSDVMLYCDVSKEKKFDNYDIMLTSRTHDFTGGTAYITLEGLKGICEGINDFYSPENIIHWIRWYQSPHRKDGHSITDMTVLTHSVKWILKKTDMKLGDLREIINDSAFEEHIGSDENNTYDMEPINIENKQIKKITWINNQPYAFNKKINKLIRLKNLHFAATRKVLMKNYRRQNPNNSKNPA